jgi:AraC-like DNA-binding protein
LVQRIAENFHENLKADDMANRIKYEIDEDTRFNINLDEITKKIFCTKSHAIRIFRSKFGITPYQYILNKKITAAKTLLKNTNLPVCEIADILSFCDSHYLSSFFKLQTGLTPKNYRKLQQESSSETVLI